MSVTNTATGSINPARKLIDTAALSASRRRSRPTTPAALARRVVPRYRMTPTVALIGNAVADAISGADRRLIVTVPPRESKSTTVAVAGTLWALSRDPDAKIILASYGDDLAREHSHAARALVAEHADELGFRLSADKTAAGRWLIDGHRGGLLATGIMSGVTGFGCDVLVLDDVLVAHRKMASIFSLNGPSCFADTGDRRRGSVLRRRGWRHPLCAATLSDGDWIVTMVVGWRRTP